MSKKLIKQIERGPAALKPVYQAAGCMIEPPAAKIMGPWVKDPERFKECEAPFHFPLFFFGCSFLIGHCIFVCVRGARNSCVVKACTRS
jgi:hypothetical protein